MNQPFNRLGRAGESSGAAADGFVFFANRVGAAFRADDRLFDFALAGLEFVHATHDFRNDLVRTANPYPRADFHALP